MIKMNQEVLIELSENGLINPLLSPIWLLKYENIYHKGTFYLKVYLLENTDISKLDEVQFEIRNEDLNFLVNVDTFNKAESYKNDSVLGCLIKLPHELENKDFDLFIRRLVINNKVIQFNEGDYGVYRLNESQTEIPKNKYLSKALNNYTFLPSHIENNMWICSCGKVNNGNKCENCNSTLEDINILIDKNLDNLFIKTYVDKNPLKIEKSKSVDEVLKKYFEPLIKFSYTTADFELFSLNLEVLSKAIDKQSRKTKKTKLILIVLMLVAALIITPTFFWFSNNQRKIKELNLIWTGKWVAQSGYTKREQIYIDFSNSLVKICEKRNCNEEVFVNFDTSKSEVISFSINNIEYTLKYHRKNYALLQYNDRDVFMAKISNYYNQND